MATGRRSPWDEDQGSEVKVNYYYRQWERSSACLTLVHGEGRGYFQGNNKQCRGLIVQQASIVVSKTQISIDIQDTSKHIN